MKKCISIVLPMVLALAAIVVISCGGSGESSGVKTFSLPHVLNTDHPVHHALVKFADEVNAQSKGTMLIKIQPGGTLGNEQELCDNVSNDMDSFTKISSTILETKTELAKIYSLPYLFRDEEHIWKVLDGAIGQELLDMAIGQNLKGITYFDAGVRSFYTKDLVTSTRDLRGMKIRVQKSVMMQKLVETLGASPQQIAFSELYTALDTGVVQGAENNIPSYFTQKHYKVAPHYVFNEHVAIPDILLMSASRWNALTTEEQAIIMNAAAIAKAFQKDLWKKSCEEQIQQMTSEGVTFTRLETKDDFIEATKSIYDEFADTEVMNYVERIRAVQ